MIRFREWLISEAAIGPQNVQYDAQGRPNFRVSIREQGKIIGLELLQGAGYKYSGDLVSDVLGDCLNLMVIATFNIDREKIDSALVRKGRLVLEHHFGPLSAEAANRVLERSGSDRRTSEPMTLAEIYNPDENYHEEPEEKRKVGF